MCTDSPTETLTVKLKNYVLRSPVAINLDDDNHAKLQAVVTAPLNVGPRQVAVRVVDVFGFVAEVVVAVASE